MKRGINGGNTEATTKTANNKICSCAHYKRISPIYQELTIIYIFSEINRECSRRQPNRSHGCCPIQGGSPLPPPGPWTSKSLSDWTWCLHLDPSGPACPARCMSPERSQHPHAFPCCPGLPGPDDVQFNRPADFESRAMGPRPPARPRIGASR